LTAGANRVEKFLELRKEYPRFSYDSFSYDIRGNALVARFSFSLPGTFSFRPTLEIPARSFYRFETLKKEQFDTLLFHIGMVEMISYWKTTCSPVIEIGCCRLSIDQERWWKKLFYHGLGEFFYRNGIDPDPEDLFTFEYKSARVLLPFRAENDQTVIIPVGGGKDSVVTMELLGAGNGNVPLMLNPRVANRECIRVKGLSEEECIVVNRTLDPQLLKMNEMGFLNGHTPFSALLAFISVLTACASGKKHIALSNESSANEPTIEGSSINHQYSKSVEFERDFRDYCKKYITPDIEYFSFLRPLNELQIARQFSRFPAYFQVFRSCNVGSKTDSWCGHCPKCLFTRIILSPFVSEENLHLIFGKNILDDASLVPVLDELTGISPEKPFECIGTVDEVNAAMAVLVRQYPSGDIPALVQHYRETHPAETYRSDPTAALLDARNEDHYLPGPFLQKLRDADAIG
jgi:UDP-N-acetyl-alpha-D-muramoyl-L-alanyl-L-glutamate epimerase